MENKTLSSFPPLRSVENPFDDPEDDLGGSFWRDYQGAIASVFWDKENRPILPLKTA
jgi:hypothetical protein